ncbi:MAG: hypothetical protein Q4F66_05495 [Clostridium sp.]|nr:hypothetical protein [Clostridium sp.]
MSKIYKTQIEDDEILKIITDLIPRDKLTDLLDKNLLYKHKCGVSSSKNKTIHIDKLRKNAFELSSVNITFRKTIIEIWDKYCTSNKKNYGTSQDIKTIISKKIEVKQITNLFECITLCWREESEELNNLGDQGYEVYKKFQDESVSDDSDNIDDFDKSENSNIKEKITMDKDFMKLSIGEALELISKSNTENEQIKKSLEEKEKEIKELRNTLNEAVENKAVKKELTSAKNAIKAVEKEFKEENQVLKKEIAELKKMNEQMLNLLTSMNKKIEETDINYMMKNVIEKQKENNNALKGSIVDSIKKNIEGIMNESEVRITAGISNNINKNISENVSQNMHDIKAVLTTKITGMSNSDGVNKNINVSGTKNEGNIIDPVPKSENKNFNDLLDEIDLFGGSGL